MFLRMAQALVLLLVFGCIGCAEAENLWFNDQAAPRFGASRDSSMVELVCDKYGRNTQVATLSFMLDELSGLVVSRTYPDIIWAHNDSGDEANVFALSISTGELVSIVRLLDVHAYDWEDIAMGPCEEGWCLYVGDIGDNLARRKNIQIHRLPEPDPYAGIWQRVEVETMTATYSTGPIDAESLFVVEDDVYILSKGNGVSNLYGAPFEAREDAVFPRRAIIEWEQRIARGGAFMATGADYATNPPRLIVRGYFAMLEFVGEEGEDIETLLQRRARRVPEGGDLQGEAVGYGPNGYYHAGERNNAPLWHVGCPANDTPECPETSDALDPEASGSSSPPDCSPPSPAKASE